MRTKYTDLHYGQVPTLYQALKNEVWKSGTAAIFSLLKCFAYDVDSDDYMIQVLVTAGYLERISCLVYKGSDGAYKKLPAEKYKKDIFARNFLRKFTKEYRHTEFRQPKQNGFIKWFGR